ncbi:MAG: NADH-quinone oxidoreductase subunit N [candidate division FCPU426 bacterium]
MLNNPIVTLASLQNLWPEITVLLGAFFVLAVDIPLRADKEKGVVAWSSMLALGLALALLLRDWNSALSPAFPGMLLGGRLAQAARLVLLVIGALTIALSRRPATRLGLVHAEYYALLLFAIAAMMVFVASANLIVAFVVLETFSLAMYVLAGFNRRDRANREAALKYFLIGAFAAAFFLFGIAIFYGVTGSVSLETLPELLKNLASDDPRRRMLMAALGMLLVGLGFKVGLAPFHLWAPDTYEGAPTPVTAFLSAGAKVAGFAMMAQMSLYFPFSHPAAVTMLGWLAVATMTLANLGALRQQGIKRLLAYSSVAHSGYALVALAGGAPSAPGAVLNYVLVYAVMNFAAFSLLLMLEESGSPVTFKEIQGLGFQRPFFGFCLAVTMFAMAGIPPTAGFVAKLNVFKSALEGGRSTLLVLAVLNSVISAAYYLRVLVALYMAPRTETQASPAFGGLTGAVLLACVGLILAWGLFPAPLLSLSAF